jgi:hypothetical protein
MGTEDQLLASRIMVRRPKQDFSVKTGMVIFLPWLRRGKRHLLALGPRYPVFSYGARDSLACCPNWTGRFNETYHSSFGSQKSWLPAPERGQQVSPGWGEGLAPKRNPGNKIRGN